MHRLSATTPDTSLPPSRRPLASAVRPRLPLQRHEPIRASIPPSLALSNRPPNGRRARTADSSPQWPAESLLRRVRELRKFHPLPPRTGTRPELHRERSPERCHLYLSHELPG